LNDQYKSAEMQLAVSSQLWVQRRCVDQPTNQSDASRCPLRSSAMPAAARLGERMMARPHLGAEDHHFVILAPDPAGHPECPAVE
jgi:hypothetical protein